MRIEMKDGQLFMLINFDEVKTGLVTDYGKSEVYISSNIPIFQWRDIFKKVNQKVQQEIEGFLADNGESKE